MRIMVSGATQAVARVASRYPDALGHLLTPRNRNSVQSLLRTGLPIVADNGAFSGFDDDAFTAMLSRLQPARDSVLWVVCPDVVADARSTAILFDIWEPIISKARLPIAFVGQDGAEDLELPWDRMDCLFIGGSTCWKLSQAAADLCAEAKLRGLLVHMGRVNTLRRLRVAVDLGCDSVDGSCYSRWSDKFLEWAIRFLNGEKRQRLLA